MSRLERLRSALEEPLLVTERRQRPLPDRVRELERGAARRARTATRALHRLPLRRGGARGRRASSSCRRARDVVGDARRAARRAADRVRGDDVTLRRSGETLARRRRSSSCRRAGSSRSCARSRTTSELDAIRRGGGDHGRGLRAARRGAVRRPHRARARLADRASSSTSTAPTALAFDVDRRRRRERRAARTRARRRPSIEAGTLVIDRLGCVVDGYCSDCTRTFATGRAAGRARASLRRLPRGAAGRARRRARRRDAAVDVDAAARDVIEAAGFGERVRPRPRPRRRARGARGAAPRARVDRHARGRERRHGRAGHLPPGRRRRPDRGPRRRHRRRPRGADAASRKELIDRSG